LHPHFRDACAVVGPHQDQLIMAPQRARRSKILEHALRQIACDAVALISQDKRAPTFRRWAALQHC
jgi:hypothetical protein